MSFPLPKRNRKEERRMLRLVRSYSLSREDAALSRNALMSRRHSITIDRCLVNLSNVAYVLENDTFAERRSRNDISPFFLGYSLLQRERAHSYYKGGYLVVGYHNSKFLEIKLALYFSI